MTQTLTNLLADVRAHLDESTATEWSDTDLTRWINEGLRDVSRHTETIQDTATIAASVGVQQYALPVTALRIYRVEWRPTSGSRIVAMEYRDFNNMDAVWWESQTSIQSQPYYFTMWGFPPSLNMVVYPTPSETGAFKVFYYRVPATLTSGSDVAEIPEGWSDLVVLYCEYIAQRRDRDPRWQEAKALYDAQLEAMLEMTRRWSDQAGMIVAENGPLPYWIVGEDYY